MAEGEVRIKDITNTVSSLNNNFYFVVDDGGVTDKTYKFSAEEYLTMGQYLMGTLNNEIDTTTAMWSASGSYVKGDVVINPTDARIYACNVANATVGTFVSSEWSALTLMGISGALFLNMSAEPMTFNQPISKGDVVYRVADASPYNPLYRGFYRAKADHPDGVASYVASDWDYFASLTALISDSNNRVMTLEDEMVTKAEQDGIYDLVSGNIKSNSYEVDTAPYLYRPSKDGSAVEEEIVGGTVAWNQLVQNGNFASGTTGWVPYSTNGTITASNNELTYTLTSVKNTFYDNTVEAQFNYIPNHIYFSTYDIYVSKTSKVNTKYINGSITQDINAGWSTLKIIFKTNGAGTNGFYGLAKASDYNYEVGDTYKIKNVNLIDLTQAFGSTIADYIYSLEQATSGSGIAWLKSYGFLTKDYYAYDSGSLQSVNVASRKIVGKNLCEGTTDYLISYSASEGKATRIVGTGTCLVTHLIKGETYTFSNGNNINRRIVAYWDEAPNIGDSTSYAQSLTGNTFTAIKSGLAIIYIYNSPIDTSVAQIEFGSIATQYEPYESKTYTFNTGELRGLFKLDANNNLVADGDVRKTDALTRKYGIVDLGQQTWYYKESGTSVAPYFYFDCTSLGIKYMGVFGTTTHNIRCVKYVTVERSTTNFVDKTMCADGGGNAVTQIQIKDSSFNGDATAFKTAMNGVYLVYELATPTTESATPFENPQLAFSGGTEEFIDGATRDVAIPVGQNSKYYLDIKGKVEQLYGIPEPPSTNGTYKLVCTVSSGVKTYSWVSN